MRQSAAAATLAILLAATPGHAFDASGADILGLRLGMTESEVAERLAHQGLQPTRTADPCSDHDICTVTIKAKTRDGDIRISLYGGSGTKQVHYHFTGHAAGESVTIKTAMSDRFGRPDQQTPMAWCRTIGSDGTCLRQQASLTFLPDTLTMILKAGEP